MCDLRPTRDLLRRIGRADPARPLSATLREGAENLAFGLSEHMAYLRECSKCGVPTAIAQINSGRQTIKVLVRPEDADAFAEAIDALDPLNLHRERLYGGEPVICPTCYLSALATLARTRAYEAQEVGARG
jgi:hypothetical protein